MKIFVLIAGMSEPSNSSFLADTFIQGLLMHPETQVERRRLRDLTIEHFTIDFYDPQCHQEEDFCALQRLIEDADGIVITTPIWNFSVPAHLKNFIDRMGSFALDETRSKGTLGGKPFFLIFTGGVPSPLWKGIMQRTTSALPQALSYFGGTYIGYHFEGRCIERSAQRGKGRGQFALVVDKRPETLKLVREKGFQFGKVVEKFTTTGTLPIKKQFLRQIYSWGQRIAKKL